MKITVFGGGGFIGSAVSDRLLKDGHQLRIFERSGIEPYRNFSHDESIKWINGDFMSSSDVAAAIDGVDLVLHLVSTTLPKSSNDDPLYDVQTNLVGTLNLLDLMVKKNVKKIVFISSGGTVYGKPIYMPMDEKHPTDPLVSYGITKLAIEKYLLLYQSLYGLKACILRVANPFGERQRVESAQGAVGVFLSKAIKQQALEIWGDGSVTRDYLYVSDLAEAFALAVKYDGPMSVFNISSNIGTNLNQLIEIIENVLGYRVARNYHPARPFDVPTSILDNSLAHKELGWNINVGLEEGIAKTTSWIKNNIVSK